LEAGKLRHRIAFYSKVVVRDAYGQETITWTLAFTVWGAVEPLLGREFLESRREEASVSSRIRIRKRDGVSPEMRATWDGHIYDITGILEVRTENREIVLMVNEVISW
jgi:SPP1 family predicted phage head-tail adaptor